MSEELTTPRTTAEIQSEFNQLAGRAGSILLQLDLSQRDLRAVQNRMLQLNDEMTAAKVVENQAKEGEIKDGTDQPETAK